MAGDKEQGKKVGARGKEAAKEEKHKAINLNDPYSIKRVLDDAVSEVVLGRGNVENVILTNVKMVIGIIACVIVVTAQFYPKKTPENKPFSIACIILAYCYVLVCVGIVAGLPALIPGSGLESTMPVDSGVGKMTVINFQTRTIIFGFVQQHWFGHFVKATSLLRFTKGGLFLEDVFFSNVEKLLDDYS